jgi:hypothetical protein
MKRSLSAIILFAMSLPAIAATAEAGAAEATVEPLGTPYVILIGLIFIGLLVGFWLYYMRWDEGEDQQDPK